jgi:hypothetical protein
MMAFAPVASTRDAARSARAPARPAEKRFTPIVVAEDPYGGIAYQLNRENEGLDIRVVKTVRREPVTPPAFETASEPPPAVASFGPMEASRDLYFAGPIEPAAPVLVARSAEVESFAPVFLPVSTLDPGDDLAVETADGFDEVGDGFATPRIFAPVAVRTFEPIEVGDEPYVGVAYELNRRHDGLGATTAVVARPGKAPDSPQSATRELSRAVRLTGEAVYAWVSVLTGPALVTVSK